MKKFISTVLALGMAASLAACGGSASTAASTESTAASAAEATADSDLAYIKNKGKMTIGYTCLLYTSNEPGNMRLIIHDQNRKHRVFPLSLRPV